MRQIIGEIDTASLAIGDISKAVPAAKLPDLLETLEALDHIELQAAVAKIAIITRIEMDLSGGEINLPPVIEALTKSASPSHYIGLPRKWIRRILKKFSVG